MGKANFTEDFKRDAVLQITERGYPVVEVAARLGISKYSLYEWRKQYGKPAVTDRDDEQAAEVRRLKRELQRVTEFVSRVLDLWAYHCGVTLDFSRPGKPTDNAFIESLDGKFRGECLNANWFMSLDGARAKCEAWRRFYNEVRPHIAIGNKPPAALFKRSSAAGSPGPPRGGDRPARW